MNYPHVDPVLLRFLQDHSIAFNYYEHIPVFTVQESESIKEMIPGKHSKNLFLTDKKGSYYLVTLEAHKRFPVNLLRKTLGCKELSFGSAEELSAYLHLTPGSVSLFGLIYAFPQPSSSLSPLHVLIDKDLRQADLIGWHPNRNDATITVDHTNLVAFLQAISCTPTIVEFSEQSLTLEPLSTQMTSMTAPPPIVQKPLTPEEQRVIIHKGTEPPYTGEYRNHVASGTYICRQCNSPLYRSSDKFDSGCGRPSFDDTFPGAVHRSTDADGLRTEITCAHCGGHLGHVFTGEHMTGKNTRHCVNSLSIKFVSDTKSSSSGATHTGTDQSTHTLISEPLTETAILGGGCFRCLESAFQQLTGVLQVLSGYSGGKRPYPSYDQVSTGATGHIEVVQVIFDPMLISYRQILEVFFSLHDPTTLDRQGSDTGPEYASIIFYTNHTQHIIAQELIQQLTDRHIRQDPIVTQLRLLEKFRIAEAYHQNYYTNNPTKPYCQTIISPKLQKLREKRKHLIK